MKLCRNGVTRVVLLIGRWAFKFPRANYGWPNFLRGLLGNMQERVFSATGWPELCPIAFALPWGFLVVMRRARPLTEEEWGAVDFDRFVNRREWHEQPIMPGKYPDDGYVPVENKIDSFGMLCGRVVAVDYGS